MVHSFYASKKQEVSMFPLLLGPFNLNLNQLNLFFEDKLSAGQEYVDFSETK